eukprot:SAG22_NODE_10873_length_512_cov_1.118644_2_plen_100_part_01
MPRTSMLELLFVTMLPVTVSPPVAAAALTSDISLTRIAALVGPVGVPVARGAYADGVYNGTTYSLRAHGHVAMDGVNELRVGLIELPGGWVARGQAFELW